MGRPKKVAVDIPSEVIDALDEVASLVEAAVIETLPTPIHVVTEELPPEIIVVPQRKMVKKIYLTVGKVALADLRAPVGYDFVWNEDKVTMYRIKPNTPLEIVIPEECSLTRWVGYYRSLGSLGIQVVKFGSEEVK